MYYQLFKRLFELIHKRTGRQAQWRHLHNRGFAGIITDMDSKQVAGALLHRYSAETITNTLKGFGRYLAELDEEQRPWLWHIQRCVIYCTVHFRRGVDLVTGQNRGIDTNHGHMMEILSCRSRNDYLELLDLIIGNNLLTIVTIITNTFFRLSAIYRQNSRLGSS
jgi:hypothetical protein